MRRGIGWLVKLYPAGWRARYGREFEAMLGEVDLRVGDYFDVLLGGLGMRMAAVNVWKLTAALAVVGLAVGTIVAFSLPEREKNRTIKVRTWSEGYLKSVVVKKQPLGAMIAPAEVLVRRPFSVESVDREGVRWSNRSTAVAGSIAAGVLIGIAFGFLRWVARLIGARAA